MLTATATERAQADVLRGLISQGQLAIDAATGWMSQVPPKPAPQPMLITLDDGSPGYRDWDISAVIGSDIDGNE
jgi:hypothetical protein